MGDAPACYTTNYLSKFYSTGPQIYRGGVEFTKLTYEHFKAS